MEFDNLFIPIDIFNKIYLNLDVKSAYQLSQTCKICYKIYSNNDTIWEKYLYEFIDDERKRIIDQKEK